MTTPQFETAVAGMADVAQWFPWRLEWDAVKSKFSKQPCTLDGTRYPVDASSPANWHDFDSVRDAVKRLDVPGASVRYAMGFYLTPAAGYVLLDIDHGLGPDGQWLPIVNQLCAEFSGAMVERSSSGRGAHIIASVAGTMPRHRNKRSLPPVDLELYSEARGVAFGLDGEATGCADTRFNLTSLVDRYFPHSVSPERDNAAPAGGFKGSDDELIRKALTARVSANVAFGGAASFADLWNGITPHDSNADAALVAHLAFWCGPDEGRIERLMRNSMLIRPKWDERRPGGTYLSHSIAEIVAKCDTFYSEPEQPSPTSGEDGAASATSDLANARRLVIAHGQDLMHVPGIGWHVWNGSGPWQCDDGHAQRLAYGLGRAIKAEADALDAWVNDASVQMTDEQKRRAEYQKTLHRWARSSEFVVSVRHTLEAAQTMLTVKADELDANPLLIGTPTGVIDLTTGTQRAHQREDRITKRVAVDYDASAKAPTWTRFIGRIMGGDRQLTEYLQTLCGYMLTAKRGEHALPVFYGSGKNGKSTFLGVVQALMADYAGTASPGLLLARKGDGDQLAAIAALRGLRLVIASESGETERLDESRVKQITGGDRLTGRPLYQNFVEFTPTHLVILQTNHRPRVNGTDEGIWRRLKLIPFAVTIPEGERDPELPEKLRAEFPGILAWMVEGWRMYQRQGFREPEAVTVATAEYRSASDAVGRFIDERCNVGPEHTSTAGGIYVAYKLWCTENGEHPMTQRALGLKLAERPGIEQVRSMSARGWRGLAVASYAELGPVAGQVIPLARKG